MHIINPEDYQYWNYEDYRQFLIHLMEEEGKTTGPNQSDFYLEIAKLNLSRMKRLDRKSRLKEENLSFLANYKRSLTFLLISEGWCGDAAQSVPVINWIVSASSIFEMKVVLRDENLDLMDAFLTNGGRSIPKLILLDSKTNEVLADWGPRPEPAQEMVQNYLNQAEPKPEYKVFHQELHAWYAKDKGKTTESEIMALLAKLQ